MQVNPLGSLSFQSVPVTMSSPAPYHSSNPLPIFHSQGGTAYHYHADTLVHSASPTRFAHAHGPFENASGSFLGAESLSTHTKAMSRTTSPVDSPLHSASGLDSFPLVGSLSRRELLQSGPLIYPSNTQATPTSTPSHLTPLSAPLSAHTASHSHPELSAVFNVASKLITSQQANQQPQRFPSLLNSAFEDIVTQMDEKRERLSLDGDSKSVSSAPTGTSSTSTNSSLHNSNADDDDTHETNHTNYSNTWNKTKQFVIIEDYSSNFEHDSSRVPLARSLDGSNDATKSL
jgi:hypothetical protein